MLPSGSAGYCRPNGDQPRTGSSLGENRIGPLAVKGTHRFRQFLALSRSEQSAFVEAALLLSLARAAVAFVPFRRIAQHIGRFQDETEPEERPDWLEKRRLVFLSLHRASHHLPWKSSCLVQAIAGQRMLLRRDVPSTLYLGLARDADSGELLAHAWLRSGEQVLTGGSASGDRYTVVGSFTAGDEP
jgi:hypothetical protein